MDDQPAISPERADIVIGWLGDSCPVQGWGTVNGHRFYFRARGNYWSMEVGDSAVGRKPDWIHEETFGVWPEAGHMSLQQAEVFIRQAAEMFVGGHASCTIPD